MTDAHVKTKKTEGYRILAHVMSALCDTFRDYGILEGTWEGYTFSLPAQLNFSQLQSHFHSFVWDSKSQCPISHFPSNKKGKYQFLLYSFRPNYAGPTMRVKEVLWILVIVVNCRNIVVRLTLVPLCLHRKWITGYL